jgi:hypothetical protein
MVKIILIGSCCRISYDIISLNLKGETSLFEWVWTNTLNEVNIIIEKMINNIQIKTIRRDGNDFLVDTNIKTCHYLNKNFDEIVHRRAVRFMNDILHNTEVLFIRDDSFKSVKYEEIDCFYSLIKQINPNLSFKFLLLSEADVFNEIDYNNLHHKIYDKTLYKKYIDDCFNLDNNNKNICVKDISDDEK